MENNNKQKITTPMAIVVAGFLIMVGLLISNNGLKVAVTKTLSEQVGVTKAQLADCIKGFDTAAFTKQYQASVQSAMKGEAGAGTPFSIIIGANGVKSKINGAETYENVKKIIDEVIAGKVTTVYSGEVPPVTTEDHIKGDPKTAQVTIIEYSDFECPFCARFHPVLEKIVSESNGNIAWVYRSFPLVQIHQHALDRAVAAECVTKIKGNDAFWKYGDLLFGLIAPVQPPADEQL